MAITPDQYVLPEQVPTSIARRVLAAVNAVADARELAARVEIENERDVGERVAARILVRRAELGAFTDLAQILEVPYVGPERFTEIVFTLGGRFAPGGPGLTGFAAPADGDAGDEPAGDLLSVDPPGRRLFLGQRTLLRARLRDSRGRAAVGHPVTFLASAGTLHSAREPVTREGSSITVPTGSDGIARVTLDSVPSAVLTVSQREALESHLSALEVSAPSPDAARPALVELAEAYHWEANRAFRDAVDKLIGEVHPRLTELLDDQDRQFAWLHRTVSVLCLAQDGERNATLGTVAADSRVERIATAVFDVIDWLPAWLELFVAHRRAASRLGTVFQDIGERAADLRVNEAFRAGISWQLTTSRGRLGDFASQRIIEEQVHRYLGSEAPGTLPPQTLDALTLELTGITQDLRTAGVANYKTYSLTPSFSHLDPRTRTVFEDLLVDPEGLAGLSSGTGDLTGMVRAPTDPAADTRSSDAGLADAELAEMTREMEHLRARLQALEQELERRR